MTFKPTVAWMQQKYDEMNQRLFNGTLGSCDFGIFTSGAGSEGRILGLFRMQSNVLYADPKNRQMYIFQNWERTYIYASNFAEMCHPKIELNGNYEGEEHSFLSVLVHEMCHYFVYMSGRSPVQPHGPEFRRISEIVSNRSNGEFTVQRLASEEVMHGLSLNDEMKEKKRKREENKKSRMNAFFIVPKVGDVELTTTSDYFLIQYLVQKAKIRSKAINGNISKVYLRNDRDMIDLLYKKGYRKNMRSYRVYKIKDFDIMKKLEEGIGEIRLDENKNSHDNIIQEVINDFVKTQTDRKLDDSDSVHIDPNMNLGIESVF